MLFTKRIDDVDNNRFGLIFANELDEQFEVAFFANMEKISGLLNVMEILT